MIKIAEERILRFLQVCTPIKNKINCSYYYTIPHYYTLEWLKGGVRRKRFWNDEQQNATLASVD